MSPVFRSRPARHRAASICLASACQGLTPTDTLRIHASVFSIESDPQMHRLFLSLIKRAHLPPIGLLSP